MAQPPSSAGPGDHALPPQPSRNGDHPLSHMMRVEAAAPPPSENGWRRFLRRLGVGRDARASAPPAAGVRPGYPLPPDPRPLPGGGGPHPVPPYGAQPQWAAPPQPVAPPPAGPAVATPPPAPAEPAAAAPTPEPGTPASTPAGGPDRHDLLTGTLAGLAMRDLALVDSLIEVVEELEDSSEDPVLLEKLFKIDNLATRMRRNGRTCWSSPDRTPATPPPNRSRCSTSRAPRSPRSASTSASASGTCPTCSSPAPRPTTSATSSPS